MTEERKTHESKIVLFYLILQANKYYSKETTQGKLEYEYAKEALNCYARVIEHQFAVPEKHMDEENKKYAESMLRK